MNEAGDSRATAPAVEVAVLVEDGGWDSVEDPVQLCTAAVSAAAAETQADAFAISVLLAGDKRLRDLNSEFRGQDKATNVLAFPSGDMAVLPAGAKPIGDIAVAYETLMTEARQQGKTLPNHLSHLVVHGTLHLLGYDHIDDSDATMMEEIERRALRRLDIADPYAGADNANE